MKVFFTNQEPPKTTGVSRDRSTPGSNLSPSSRQSPKSEVRNPKKIRSQKARMAVKSSRPHGKPFWRLLSPMPHSNCSSACAGVDETAPRVLKTSDFGFRTSDGQRSFVIRHSYGGLLAPATSNL